LSQHGDVVAGPQPVHLHPRESHWVFLFSAAAASEFLFPPDFLSSFCATARLVFLRDGHSRPRSSNRNGGCDCISARRPHPRSRQFSFSREATAPSFFFPGYSCFFRVAAELARDRSADLADIFLAEVDPTSVHTSSDTAVFLWVAAAPSFLFLCYLSSVPFSHSRERASVSVWRR
jgi:hypothetical protein